MIDATNAAPVPTPTAPSAAATNAQNIVRAIALGVKLLPIPEAGLVGIGLDQLAAAVPSMVAVIEGWKKQGHITLQDVLDAEHAEIMAADARRDTAAAVAVLEVQ